MFFIFYYKLFYSASPHLRVSACKKISCREMARFHGLRTNNLPGTILFLNEGKLPPEVPVEKLKTEHLSKPRNKLLADVFYKAGFIEGWGRGTIEIVNRCLEQELPEPDFIEEYGVFKLTIYKNKWTEENFRKIGLNERQIKLIFYVREKGKITNKEYQELNRISRATATRDLQELVEKKILEQFGSKGQGTFYRLIAS